MRPRLSWPWCWRSVGWLRSGGGWGRLRRWWSRERGDTGDNPRMSLVGVIDFETTGLSPAMGDRATEIAIVLTEHGKVVARFQSLMNAGVRIPAFIEQYTGISNEMI